MPERLLRERAVFKVHSDFVSAATRGAIAVIDGNVMAINPGEDPKMQMFIWNNIFFSLGFDVRDHYKVKMLKISFSRFKGFDNFVTHLNFDDEIPIPT